MRASTLLKSPVPESESSNSDIESHHFSVTRRDSFIGVDEQKHYSKGGECTASGMAAKMPTVSPRDHAGECPR
jgi:hypothetical protein